MTTEPVCKENPAVREVFEASSSGKTSTPRTDETIRQGRQMHDRKRYGDYTD